MLFLLSSFVIGGIIGIIISICDDDWGWFVGWTIGVGCLGLALSVIILVISYDSAVDQHKRLGIIEQYVSRIQVYESKAKGNFETAEITDMKYNKFQEQLGTMVTSLGTQIVYYNKCQIGKKLYSSNWFFKGLISYDPELPATIKMEDYIK